MSLVFGQDDTCQPGRCVHVARNLRDEGMARVSAEPSWVVAADLWVRSLTEGSEFTAETLTAAVGRPSHPNAVGARLSALARQGLIVESGYVQATRTERHASRMLRWRRV